MNAAILRREVQDFIHEKSSKPIDISKLILSGSPFSDISSQELAQQIKGRLKAKDKLSLWYHTKGIYYPPSINMEQTSSELTGLYKSKLVSGERLIDLTGGLGIDDYYFSKVINKVTHCELNESLSLIATHNFSALGASNIVTHTGDAISYLQNQEYQYDWIYIDPSRRNDIKGKVFFLEDCLPDVPKHIDLLFSRSTNVLIKTSPLLDIQTGIKSLQFVKEIHCVAVKNEVKELIWVLSKDYIGKVHITSCNITNDQQKLFSFSIEEEVTASCSFSSPKKYLYEPNAAILKSGAFKCVATRYGLDKLHPHSHLYTSDMLIDFPGRRFEIISHAPYHKKNLKANAITKANITVRNFNETVANLRKKLKIKDGGTDYLFFTTDATGAKISIHCKKA
ncbi:class I SAM-dependent methyltransferase [Aquimarina hainanensis]|uniref:Class I SAM-dependent methyltransferase n=1 Tax=Aquimarina hainanensis TaxID=1578017 RepID=A0ABW5NA22_9FLAO